MTRFPIVILMFSSAIASAQSVSAAPDEACLACQELTTFTPLTTTLSNADRDQAVALKRTGIGLLVVGAAATAAMSGTMYGMFTASLGDIFCSHACPNPNGYAYASIGLGVTAAVTLVSGSALLGVASARLKKRVVPAVDLMGLRDGGILQVGARF